MLPRLRRQVGRGIGERLDAGLLVVGDDPIFSGFSFGAKFLMGLPTH
jgi:hypothetical protein